MPFIRVCIVVNARLIDLGIAIAHFDLACEAEGLKGSWEPFEDSQSDLRTKLRMPDDVRLIGVWKQQAAARLT